MDDSDLPQSDSHKQGLTGADVQLDNNDLSVAQDQQDALDVDPEYTEERFRVDRRKLEQMLQQSENFSGAEVASDDAIAKEFFHKVEEETGTQITWPSKLKIGAKSKKDPHIKVSGKRNAVFQAKEKILCVLDTKSNRVTLKMDVSHTDHSHVIGKGGNNIKRVMQETGCHIHFPDSNRSSQTEKSNQVSIAGQATGVEQARSQIRELLPLVLMFELPVAGLLQPVPDASSHIIQQIQSTYKVNITFKQRPHVYITTVIVRGCVENVKSVKEATAYLIENLTGNVGASLPVSTQLEIAPQHHLFMIGRGGANIKQIMERTGANIHFPDPGNVQPQRKGTVFITGGIDSVYTARQQLIGCLPLVLMFDMKENIEVDQGHISQLMEELDVFISVKPKPKQPNKSVIVKSIERNATKMYEARKRLLGLNEPLPEMQMSGLTIEDTSPSSQCLAALGLLNQDISKVNPLTSNNPQVSVSNSHSPMSVQTKMLASNPSLYSPVLIVPSHSTYVLQNNYGAYPQNGFGKAFNQKSAFVKGLSSTNKGESNMCPQEEKITLEKCSTLVPNAAGTFAENLNQFEYGSAAFFDNLLPCKGRGYSSSTSDLRTKAGPLSNPSAATNISGAQLSSSTSSLPSSGSHHRQPVCFEDVACPLSFNGERQSSESGAESDGSDHRMLQSEQHPSSPSAILFPGSQIFGADYENMKLQATKAIQKKPVGESRIPTDYWSGLGFSKSMPGSAIRDRLRQNNVSAYTGPNMSTTFEGVPENDEEDCDPWKESNCNKRSDINSSFHGNNVTVGEDSVRTSHSEASTQRSIESCIGKVDLAELFRELGLGKYTDLFHQQEIDIATFLTLTDQDLKELGITTFGARRKMLLAIADINKPQSMISAISHPLNMPSDVPFQDNGVRQPIDSTECRRPPLNAAPGSDNPFRDNRPSILPTRRHDIVSQSGRW